MLVHTNGVCDFIHSAYRALYLPRWGRDMAFYPARVHLGTCSCAERPLSLTWALLPWMRAGSLPLYSRVEETSSFHLKYTILTARLPGRMLTTRKEESRLLPPLPAGIREERTAPQYGWSAGCARAAWLRLPDPSLAALVSPPCFGLTARPRPSLLRWRAGPASRLVPPPGCLVRG